MARACTPSARGPTRSPRAPIARSDWPCASSRLPMPPRTTFRAVAYCSRAALRPARRSRESPDGVVFGRSPASPAAEERGGDIADAGVADLVVLL